MYHLYQAQQATVASVRSHTNPGAVAFLHTSTWDVSLYLENAGTSPLDHLGIWRVPSPTPSLHTPQFGTEMTSTQYSAAMQMVTSQGDLRQDICSLLYRMSLNDETAPSLAVRHSMNAISYLHLQNSAKSIHHHMLAVSALRQTISQMLDYNTRSQAIAASMLLSIYETWHG
ncbi:hypothetical protein QQX98_009458 [Neonectria punicea]|uniref:Uncharacterized protein n=1 Tax=Neonectria punicea TaxID=979145 RepID=A0ABR1GS68_9HYPO